MDSLDSIPVKMVKQVSFVSTPAFTLRKWERGSGEFAANPTWYDRSMINQRKLDGIILRRNNLGEADRIVTLLTPQGKLAVVAKSIRRLTSRKAGSLELFGVVHLLLRETNDLPVIQEVEIIESFPRLRTDLAATAQAFWAAELVDRLVGEEAGGTLYTELLTYLGRVERGATDLDVRAFELVVLNDLGWQPSLMQCAHCNQPLERGKLGWSNRLGGVIGQSCLSTQSVDRPITEQAVKALRLLADHSLAVSQRLQVPLAIGAEVQEILHHYLESVSERRWKSPELLNS